MGDARRKKDRYRNILENNPICIFCGLSPSDTIDHVPPRSMFDRRDRPAGLEFPSCKSCNLQSSRFEVMASVVARFTSDEDQVFEEFKALADNLRHFDPLVLNDLTRMPRASEKRRLKELGYGPEYVIANFGGLLNSDYLIGFAAKLGLALFFNETKKILTNNDCMWVTWMTGNEAAQLSFEKDFVEHFSAAKTLTQGRKEVGRQFVYTSAISHDHEAAFFIANFRNSLVAMAAIYLGGSSSLEPKLPSRWRKFTPLTYASFVLAVC